MTLKRVAIVKPCCYVCNKPQQYYVHFMCCYTLCTSVNGECSVSCFLHYISVKFSRVFCVRGEKNKTRLNSVDYIRF